MNLFRDHLLPQPSFSESDINHLPNIFEVIDKIKVLEQALLQRDNGWTDYDMMKDTGMSGMPLHAINHILCSDRVYINNEDPDCFILNRLASGRYCLKPNLRTHRFLFRGQKKHYSLIQSSFSRQNLFNQNISRIKYEEFVQLLRSHPLFMLFEHGIHLEGISKPLFLEMNYYGLSQHYNFNTGLVDFTSDIMAAAFFAVTKNNGDDNYEPYGGSPDNKVGVIYIHKINPFATFCAHGFGTIGQQIYPRTGAQKGFCYQEGRSKIPVENLVTPVFFRHDLECAKGLFKYMHSGETLFPKDDLSVISHEINHSKMISGESFTKYMYFCQNDASEVIRILTDNGISINWHNKRLFYPNMLKQYYENIRNGWWEEFCNKIAIINSNEKQIKESLLNLPKNPNYKQFFDPRQLELLHFFNYNRYNRAPCS